MDVKELEKMSLEELESLRTEAAREHVEVVRKSKERIRLLNQIVDRKHAEVHTEKLLDKATPETLELLKQRLGPEAVKSSEEVGTPGE